MVEKKRFFIGSSSFSIYEDMATVLMETGRWSAERDMKRMTRCELILGDRFDIPYHLLVTGPPNCRRRINYFRGSHRLTLKASMAQLLQDESAPPPAWLPLTFVLGGRREAGDGREGLRKAAHAEPGIVWIVKPSAGCGGSGVRIMTDAAAICEHVDAANSTGKAYFAVQRYIHRPMLIRGRKFDVRVWVLLAHPFEIYQFSQGSCRTASTPYSTDDFTCTQSHITNHCLQEQSADFGKYEEGNEMWYDALDEYLAETSGRGRGVVASVLKPQFASIAKATLLAAKEILEVPPGAPYECFQLFGFDFLVDADLQVHLLEINGSPGAAQRWLRPLVTTMLDIVAPGEAPAALLQAAHEDGASWEPIFTSPLKDAPIVSPALDSLPH